jgi:F-type H+-transporting ATPase subunit epsilon
MENTFILEVVTPSRLIIKEDGVNEVSAPGIKGYFTALPMHAPFLASLSKGTLSYRRGKTWSHISVMDGFVEVLHNRIIILAEKSETPDDLDIDRALSAKKRAEERLKDINNYDIDFDRARAALERSMIRIRTKELAQK